MINYQEFLSYLDEKIKLFDENNESHIVCGLEYAREELTRNHQQEMANIENLWPRCVTCGAILPMTATLLYEKEEFKGWQFFLDVQNIDNIECKDSFVMRAPHKCEKKEKKND